MLSELGFYQSTTGWGTWIPDFGKALLSADMRKQITYIHPQPYTLHTTHYTLHTTPCTLHPTHYTPHTHACLCASVHPPQMGIGAIHNLSCVWGPNLAKSQFSVQGSCFQTSTPPPPGMSRELRAEVPPCLGVRAYGGMCRRLCPPMTTIGP